MLPPGQAFRCLLLLCETCAWPSSGTARVEGAALSPLAFREELGLGNASNHRAVVEFALSLLISVPAFFSPLLTLLKNARRKYLEEEKKKKSD